ncbi:PTS sugar transporter subunit IIC [Deferribacteraceae bacterium V6Fe1]|nr:PTS sugar transporter subunit IIC [Deferribacteraceae bacterium V6Fe1]
MAKWAFIIFFSGLISADRSTALHMMFSRPLIVSLVIGLLTSHLYLCLLCGIMIEIYGSVDVPVGTKIPKDDTFMAYLMSLLIGFEALTTPTDFILAAFLAILFVYPVTFLEYVLRKINMAMYESFMKKNLLDPKRLIVRSFILSFLRGVIIYNAVFMLVFFMLNQLELDLRIFGETNQYFLIMIIFLAGYLIRFLSFKSIYKYLVFVAGAIIGWFVI